MISRAIKFLFILLLAGTGFFFYSGHQFGSRPQDSLAELKPDPSIKFIEANGLRFGYLEQGEGPLVLMFHGYPENAYSWKHLQQDLAKEGYRTIAVFMRGYVPSDFAMEYSVHSLGEDILALIEAFGGEPAVIIGHDWGASAVYQAAYSKPEKIRKLVALSIPHPAGIAGDPGVLLEAPHFLYYQSPFSSRLVWSHDFAHIDRIYEGWSPGYDFPKSETTQIREALKVPGAIEGALGYYWSFFSEGEERSGPPAESKINVPSLIIAGDQDGTVNVERFSKAQPAFTGTYQFELLEGVGHFPQIEAPGKLSRLIINFIK